MSEILTRKDLKYLLIDSLNLYTEDSVYVSGNNPYCFKINKKIFYIFIHNVHDSGSGRPNEDECRIQVNRSDNFIAAQRSGLPVLFLGYYTGNNTFTAWDPLIQTRRINQRGVISLYSRWSVLRKSADVGLSVYLDDDKQVVISFKPEYLGLYLENFKSIHKSDESNLLSLIKKSDATNTTEEEVGTEVSLGREMFTVTHKQFRRSSGFRILINEAYSARCTMCGIQLELVEAAHIVPHSHERGTDDITNGLCLCHIHHKAFDKGLIYIDNNYNIHINDSKIDYLTKIHRDGGLQKFSKLQFEKISLPQSHVSYPSKEYIKLGNKIRGI